MQNDTRPNFILRFLGALPIIGYALRCIREERLNELAWLGLNFALAITLALLLWGYAALITVLLGMTAIVGALVLSSTLG